MSDKLPALEQRESTSTRTRSKQPFAPRGDSDDPEGGACE